MKYVRAKDQKDIKVGSMVRLLPTMGWRQTPTNPIGGIGVVTKVRIGASGIYVKWKFNGTGEPINKQNGAYILGRDLEILEDNSIKSFHIRTNTFLYYDKRF